ncbi:hypothetical protein [Victivallis sp. Marseille-Q1083]|uniref:hypothetical protein n=1 Tax=Victivallis sp. Marseille-Q1083 TaxID=2717288 RepID=UPI00158A68A0|nr:hypothetical protein [Victivallis sp. Marseille-Q1083]
MIELVMLLYCFSSVLPPTASLTSDRPQACLAAAPTEAGFSIQLTAALSDAPASAVLLEIPDAVVLRLRQAGTDPAENAEDRRQNYVNYQLPDGSCPVLEAVLTLHSEAHPDWREMRIGFPLARLERLDGVRQITLQFTGARWQIFADGKLMDEDFPVGFPRWQQSAEWRIDPALVSGAELRQPSVRAESRPAAGAPRKGIQYFTPEGHNTWVGDVVTFFHAGRYHIFYLLDRRHHSSKFGQGGHYFAHLSSTDLRHWTEHEPAIDLTEQWETCGTGTVFFHHNQYYFSYGLHTTRMVPYEKTALPAQWDYLEKHGETGIFHPGEYDGYPAGSTYAVSDDGIHFEKTGILMHPCENPSIYTLPDDSLLLFAGYGASGSWRAARQPGHWVCENPDFPPYGKQSVMRNSTECQCYFQWNQYHYLLGGFSGFWISPTGEAGSYIDSAAAGSDPYDGLGVPMVAEFTGNRRIMAGWLGGLGWGGYLVLRELVQYPDGRLGLKWPPEVVPPTAEPMSLATRLSPAELHGDGRAFGELPAQSFRLDLDIDPGKTAAGRFAIRLTGAAGQPGCELQLRLGERYAQYGSADGNRFAAAIPSARELIAAECPELEAATHLKNPNLHQRGGNFAIEQVDGMDRPFHLSLLVYHDPKMNGSIVDAEIAGQRTLISCRPGLTVSQLVLAADAPDLEVRNLQLAPLQPDSDSISTAGRR